MPSLFYEEYYAIWVAFTFCFFIMVLNRFNIYSVGSNLYSFFESIFVSLNLIKSEPFERKKTMLALSSIFFLSFCLIRFLSIFILIDGLIRFLYVAYCLFLFWMYRNEVIPFLLSSKPVQLLIYYCMAFEEMFLSSPIVSRVLNSILFIGGLTCYVIVLNDFLPVQILSFVFYFYRTATRLFLGSNLNDLKASPQSDLEEEPLEDSFFKDEDFDWALVSLYMSRVSVLAFGKPINWQLDDRKSKSLFPLVVKRHYGENIKAFFRAFGRGWRKAADSVSQSINNDPLQHLWGSIGAGGSLIVIISYLKGVDNGSSKGVNERLIGVLERLEAALPPPGSGVSEEVLAKAMEEFQKHPLTKEEQKALKEAIKLALDEVMEETLRKSTEAAVKAAQEAPKDASTKALEDFIKQSLANSNKELQKESDKAAQKAVDRIMNSKSREWGVSPENLERIRKGKGPSDTSLNMEYLP